MWPEEGSIWKVLQCNWWWAGQEASGLLCPHSQGEGRRGLENVCEGTQALVTWCVRTAGGEGAEEWGGVGVGMLASGRVLGQDTGTRVQWRTDSVLQSPGLFLAAFADLWALDLPPPL